MTVTGNRAVRRRTDEAIELAEALAHHRAGRLKQAAQGYRRVLARLPREPNALHLLGLIALDGGDAERAVRLIEKAIVALPDFAEAHSDLGNALRAAGHVAAACESYRKAISHNPNLAPAHNNLGLLLCEQGDFAAAVMSCRQAVALAPGLAEAHNNLGNALRGLGEFAAAEAAFRRALEIEPTARRYVNLGNLLVDRGQSEEADRCYRRAIALHPDSAAAHHGLASALRQRGMVAAAIASYRKAAELDPSQATVWTELGAVLRAAGRLAEAIEAFRRALAVDRDFTEAYRHLAGCGALPADGEEAAQANALAARPDLAPERRAAAGFAIAKAFDDAARFDEAFAAYAQANRLYRGWRNALGEQFDATALSRQVEETIATFASAHFRTVSDWGNPSELPVFIVGMPRSGTSLVEQIAASHSRVCGVGELRDVADLAAAIAPGIATKGRALIRHHADAHLERIKTLGGDTFRVIDKLPDNIFHLGVIATLFPNARIVFCRRDPRDVCLSCYFQQFTAGHLLFSYDLIDCAKRLRQTERLMTYWEEILPLHWHEVCYENLVSDLAGESRRLIAFLGLAWEPGCLDFYRTERTVTTASAWQVRQPLYDRSVGRWRHYSSHLGPLFQALAG